MKFWCGLLLLSAVALGCGGPGVPQAAPPEVKDANSLKERLKFISTSGGTGSALAGIPELVEKEGNPALVAEAKKLAEAKTPDQAKAIAKTMLEILDKPK